MMSHSETHAGSANQHTTHNIQSLVSYYESELTRLEHRADPIQRHAVVQLEELRQRLIVNAQPVTFWQRILPISNNRNAPERGLYFWGGVGRGKTWLMDMFYHSLPFKQKQRSHFHRYMQFIHEELKTHRNRADPLDIISEKIARKTRVLCFDELYVSDIADAMLLGNLFRGLFDRGVALVATSNCAPDELYKDGLQRARFLPTIKLLKNNTHIFNLDSGIDYRLRHLEHARTWFDTNHPDTSKEMLSIFNHLTESSFTENSTLEINHRKIKVRYLGNSALWFDFTDLCDGPRGPADYIELARCYHAIFISNMPQLNASTDNQARRFINLVDEFYDRGVKLFVSAATVPEQIYQGTQLSFDFRRCLSRLTEMQSQEYLSLPHKP